MHAINYASNPYLVNSFSDPPLKVVQVGNHQEKAQSEKHSHLYAFLHIDF